MRITYIHQHFGTPEEGGGQRPFEFARRLADKGHQVTVIRDAPRIPTTARHCFSVVSVKTRYRNDLGTIGRITAFVAFAVKSTVVACRTDADVIFASSTPLTVAIPGVIAHRFKRVPMVFEVRDLWPEVPIQLGYLKDPISKFLARALERTAYRESQEIVALSPTMKAGVERVAPEKPVALIPNTSNIEVFDRNAPSRSRARACLGVPDGARMLVYAGSLGVSYDPRWLIDLAAADPNLLVFVLGDGRLLPELRERASALGLDARRVLPGDTPHRGVVTHYAAADLIVSSLIPHPSLKDNSLNKVFDAFAAGRPVVFNHDGWLAELASSHQAGWVVDSTRLHDVAQMIMGLSDSEIEAAGRAAARLGRERFATTRLVGDFERVLERAAGAT